MEDLGQALTVNRSALMMGGGNPALVDDVQAVWDRRVREMLDETPGWPAVLANYDPPGGNPAFRAALAGFLERQCGWPLSAGNIAVTSGGQTAFFYLHNLFAGRRGDQRRRILFPIMPEYIGYADQCLDPGSFVGIPAQIETHGDHRFKYRVDFDRLRITPDIAALCVSRPTNPSSNVLTNDELRHLGDLATEHGIPLIVDSAYGLPFPGVVFPEEAQPFWNEQVILTLSLSKLGLPGTRTGMVVAAPEVCRQMGSLTAITGLANGNVGQAIVTPLLDDDTIADLSSTIIRPHYRERCEQALAWLDSALEGLPYRVHDPEGAFFLWLWLPELPITATKLYQRLKAEGVIVVPGEYFFYGLDEPWAHASQCLRISYTQPPDRVARGMELLGKVIREVH